VGEGCKIEHSRLDGCRIGDGTDCGPFVRIRPGTEIGEHVHVGSFAEINRTSIGAGSRVPHFSYLGDAVIGRNVNIAAGTITANYDGVAKHKTVIEDDVFVGVDTMLRAPVKLGKGSRTGAGAVVLDEVPPGETVVGVPARPVRKEGRHRS
jgi:bifunctional UDP-N-acetylglucosamine pyrophosphorylase/glucosamine-1-phosphate N-acetyltransferase